MTLTELRDQGLTFEMNRKEDGWKLLVSPKEKLTPELIGMIAESREQLLDELEAERTPIWTPGVDFHFDTFGWGYWR